MPIDVSVGYVNMNVRIVYMFLGVFLTDAEVFLLV